jgi:hypothetical protein
MDGRGPKGRSGKEGRAEVDPFNRPDEGICGDSRPRLPRVSTSKMLVSRPATCAKSRRSSRSEWKGPKSKIIRSQEQQDPLRRRNVKLQEEKPESASKAESSDDCRMVRRMPLRSRHSSSHPEDHGLRSIGTSKQRARLGKCRTEFAK